MKRIIQKKMEILGGTTHHNQATHPHTALHTLLQQVSLQMQALPEQEVVEFINNYGGTAFKNEVFLPITQEPEFPLGYVPVKHIMGWASNHSIIDYIATHASSTEFPLFESTEDGIIFYSLQKEYCGKIFYKHDNAGYDNNALLLSESFEGFIGALYSR